METFSALLAICAGNSPVQWRGALVLSLICTRIIGWANNGEAGDLRRHRAHYDVTVLCNSNPCNRWQHHRGCMHWWCEAFALLMNMFIGKSVFARITDKHLNPIVFYGRKNSMSNMSTRSRLTRNLCLYLWFTCSLRWLQFVWVSHVSGMNKRIYSYTSVDIFVC